MDHVRRMMPLIGTGLVALMLIFAVVACQPTAPMEDTALPPTATLSPVTATPPAPSATPTPAGQEAPPATAPLPQTALPELSPEAEQVIALAQENLAERLGLAEEAIQVRSVEPVTWPDASLGCPQPGMAYAQVLTPGFRVILEAGGQVYEYHTGTPQPIVLCEKEGSTMEDSLVPGTIEPGLEALVDQAKEDLTLRLSVATEQITVLEAKAVVWPDSSLGCPQPGMEYLQVPRDGTLIRLGVEGQVYEYHGGGGREMFLCEQPLKLQKDTPPQLDLLQLPPGSPDE